MLNRVLGLRNEEWVNGTAPGLCVALAGSNSDVRPNDLLPRSSATLSNVTIIGNDEWVAGGRARRGSAIQLLNSIVTGAPHGIDIDFDEEASTYDLFTSGDSVFAGVVLDAASGDAIRDDGDIPAGFVDTHVDDGNNVLGSSSLVNDYFAGGVEDTVTPVDTTAYGLEAAAYVGAFSPSETPESNWAAGWTKPGTVFVVEDASCPVMNM